MEGPQGAPRRAQACERSPGRCEGCVNPCARLRAVTSMAMFLALVFGLLLQGRITGTVVDEAGARVARARVILGEFGRATLFYNTAEEMFVGTPGLSDAEAQRYSAVLET